MYPVLFAICAGRCPVLAGGLPTQPAGGREELPGISGNPFAARVAVTVPRHAPERLRHRRLGRGWTAAQEVTNEPCEPNQVVFRGRSGSHGVALRHGVVGMLVRPFSAPVTVLEEYTTFGFDEHFDVEVT